MSMSGRTTLYLVRHGEVVGKGTLYGHTEVPLTAEGERQLQRVAERLRAEPLAAVYASDLSRCRLGAETVAAVHGLDVVCDSSFRELNMGAWEGRTFSDLLRDEPEAMSTWWADLVGVRLPGGESLGDLRLRVLDGLSRLLERHRGQTVCLVAHGGTNRAILFEAMGLSLARFHCLAQDFGALNRIDYYEDGSAVVSLVNG
jgi:alpha-ribazole phosphatase/probable phosphoglycerate mutase